MTRTDGKPLTGGWNAAATIIAVACVSLILANGASADLSCSVKTACTGDEEEIFSMSGLTNAHVETASETHYGYHVCCGGIGTGILGTSCNAARSTTILNISAATNAHAENPLVATYPTGICLSTSIGMPLCTIASGACPADNVCLASISADTNAHVGDCSAYTRKACCLANRPPSVEGINPPPGDARGEITFNATVSDPDGDPVQRVEFNITFTGGSWIIGTDTSAPWQATWNSYIDIQDRIDTAVTIRARAFDGVSWGSYHEETFTVNNTRPNVWLTGPANWTRTGNIFNVTWDDNHYASDYDFQYVDRGDYRNGINWSSLPRTAEKYATLNLTGAASNAEYCYRVKGVDAEDGIPGTWNCNPPAGVFAGQPGADPVAYGCTCVKMDTVSPLSEIYTATRYTRSQTFPVTWSGSDADTNVSCYKIQYRVYDEWNGTELQSWTAWPRVNNFERLTFSGGGCEMESCTISTSGFFNHTADLPAGIRNTDGHTIQMRIIAIDNAYGCANAAGAYAVSANITAYDTTSPPDVSAYATDADGTTLPSPDGVLYMPDQSTFIVATDPDLKDYTRVRSNGVRYWLRKPGSGVIMGKLDGTEMRCADGQATGCSLVSPLWYKDYNVTYQGFATDRAGNEKVTAMKSFLALKPMKLEADTDNLYMTLGSSRAVTITISNRQTINDTMKVVIQGYQFARFTNESAGTTSEGGRVITVELQPKQGKTLYMMVSTSEIGEDYSLAVIGNTTRAGLETKIEDLVEMDIRVVYPHEFPGPGPQYAVIAAAVAAAVYAAFLLGRKD